MSETNSNARRKVLAGLGGGLFGATQMPKSWTKPVVDSVLLPVHAATTTTDSEAQQTGPNFSGSFNLVQTTKNDSNSFMQDVLSVVVEDAHAGLILTEGKMCILVTPPAEAGQSYTVKALLGNGIHGGVYTGTGTIGGGSITLTFANGCDNSFVNTVEVSSVSSEGISYSLITPTTKAEGILPSSGNEIDCPDDSQCD